MPNFAVKNLMDIEPGGSDQFEIRFSRKYLDSEQLGITYERIELKQWDVVRVAPEVVRGFEPGPEGMVLIAVGGTKPEGGDGEIVKDRWPA